MRAHLRLIKAPPLALAAGGVHCMQRHTEHSRKPVGVRHGLLGVRAGERALDVPAVAEEDDLVAGSMERALQITDFLINEIRKGR